MTKKKEATHSHTQRHTVHMETLQCTQICSTQKHRELQTTFSKPECCACSLCDDLSLHSRHCLFPPLPASPSNPSGLGQMVIKVHTGWEKGNFCKEQAKISSSLMLVHLPGSLLVDHEVQKQGGKASQSIPWQKERLSSKIQKIKLEGLFSGFFVSHNSYPRIGLQQAALQNNSSNTSSTSIQMVLPFIC